MIRDKVAKMQYLIEDNDVMALVKKTHIKIQLQRYINLKSFEIAALKLSIPATSRTFGWRSFQSRMVRGKQNKTKQTKQNKTKQNKKN